MRTTAPTSHAAEPLVNVTKSYKMQHIKTHYRLSAHALIAACSDQ